MKRNKLFQEETFHYDNYYNVNLDVDLDECQDMDEEELLSLLRHEEEDKKYLLKDIEFFARTLRNSHDEFLFAAGLAAINCFVFPFCNDPSIDRYFASVLGSLVCFVVILFLNAFVHSSNSPMHHISTGLKYFLYLLICLAMPLIVYGLFQLI